MPTIQNLVWKQDLSSNSNICYTAETVLLSKYVIFLRENNTYDLFLLSYDINPANNNKVHRTIKTGITSLEEAKSKGQRDYNKRIESAFKK